MVWDKVRPTGKAKEGKAQLQDNFGALEIALAKGHEFPGADGDEGRHLPGLCGVVFEGTLVAIEALPKEEGALAKCLDDGWTYRCDGENWLKHFQHNLNTIVGVEHDPITGQHSLGGEGVITVVKVRPNLASSPAYLPSIHGYQTDPTSYVNNVVIKPDPQVLFSLSHIASGDTPDYNFDLRTVGSRFIPSAAHTVIVNVYIREHSWSNTLPTLSPSVTVMTGANFNSLHSSLRYQGHVSAGGGASRNARLVYLPVNTTWNTLVHLYNAGDTDVEITLVGWISAA